ncbi:MAG: metalloregulator ArsR/SmtB family transcription factor [Kaiparowitsia implicata GSE-PSE-MK54-09C]|nr:metalloregulator ArsR/SmtB family transcription factor [Kaiparowitsia implicata GSE-PSE-MK54-09C]
MSSASVDCAQRLRVLADAHRLAILKLLVAGPQYVWQLNHALNLEQSLLSHHLKTLRETGFVESRRDGKAVLYQLVPGVRLGSRDGIDLGCCTLLFRDLP